MHYEQEQENELLVMGVGPAELNLARLLNVDWEKVKEVFLQAGIEALQKFLQELSNEANPVESSVSTLTGDDS
jgi:hypothetical protein